VKNLLSGIVATLATAVTFNAGSAHAEIIYEQTFVRGTGAPITESFAVDLTNAGELRISNQSLDDGAEVAAGTSIELDGVSILDPFHVEVGVVYVRGLDAGAHTIALTMRGRPGGELLLQVDERSDGVKEVGFELLPDGTVRQKATGLIWHRNGTTPGWQDGPEGQGVLPGSGNRATARDALLGYVADMNAGVFGTDPLEGNAGHTDWRLPTQDEMRSMFDWRFRNPMIADKNGGGTIFPAPAFGIAAGHKFGDPFYICPFIQSPPPLPPEYDCNFDPATARFWIPAPTLDLADPSRGFPTLSVNMENGELLNRGNTVWLVREP
jgi:hypothetical protein